MCVTLRNAIYFHLHPARGLAHPVCTHTLSALAGTGHSAGCMARDGASAGNDMDCEPGTTGTASLVPVMVLLAQPGTVSLALGTASLAPAMVRLASPGMYVWHRGR